MKKSIIIGFLITVLIISCTPLAITHGTDSDHSIQKNYIPYYIKADLAKKLYEKGKRKESFLLLDSLFDKFKPINSLFVDELDFYCDLAVEFNKKDKLEEIVEILINDYGYNIAQYNDEKWMRVKNNIKFSQDELKSKYSQYQNNLNIELRDSIIGIFRKDQEIRKTKSPHKIDSLDRLHEPYHINFIRKNGYPGFKKVGGNGINDPISPAYMSVMLKHISLEGALILEPILLQEVRKGNCPPVIYAGMLDVHKIVLKEDTPFPYYGTYSSSIPVDTTATNDAREKIGLPRMKF